MFNHPHVWAAVSLVAFVLARDARREPPEIVYRPPAHRGANERARGRFARHLGVRREAVRVRRLRGLGGRGGHPRRLPRPGDHVHGVQRVRVDQQSRERGDRRSRLRPRRGVRRTERDRRASGRSSSRTGSTSNQWDLVIGSLILFVILIVNQNGIADVVVHGRRFWEELHLVAARPVRRPLPPAEIEPVPAATLSLTGLTVRFGSVVALDDVAMEVRPGEVVGLIGPNGSGKTTLIDAVTGFVSVGGGSISLDGRRIDGLNATKRARLGLRRSFQSLELFEDVSVEENIRAGSDLVASSMSWVTDLFWPRPTRPGTHRRRRGTGVRARDLPRQHARRAAVRPAPAGRHRPDRRVGSLGRAARRTGRRPRRARERRPRAGSFDASPKSATWPSSSSSTTSDS